jgi:uncharacterized membrane protein (UPF0127 family)
MDFGRTKIYAVLFVVVGIIIIAFLTTMHYPSQIILKGKVYTVDVADTTYTMNKGYSGHPPISHNEGMIFVFPENDKHGFWMKDMLFPIDILWLDAEGTIVHIEHNVTPETYPTVFRSPKAARFVLETNAYYTDTFGITIGQTAVLPKEVFVQN